MKSESFAYWLQGFFEVANPETIDKEQVQIIKNHLAMVFKHEIDPSLGDKKHIEELSKLHTPDKTSLEKSLGMKYCADGRRESQAGYKASGADMQINC